ncbi:MAG: glycerophosphodiester phosphodiesterase family protein [Rubripirellula sp.]
MIKIRGLLAVALLFGSATHATSQVVVAHRGASRDAPENTLSAFKLAWQQGSDGIEGDFYLTADQQIVCIHDRDTKRTAGIKKVVEQSTLAELQTLEYGSWKDPKWKGEPIPTFEEVLQTVPKGKLFVIELKSKTAIVPVLKAELAKHDTGHIELLIIAFDQATAAACKDQMPTVKVHWLTSFKESKTDSSLHPTAPEIAAIVRELGVEGVGMQGNRDVITKDFAAKLRAGDCNEFHVWTIDSVDDAKYFQSLGAIGVTTNVPAVIGDAIRDKVPR